VGSIGEPDTGRVGLSLRVDGVGSEGCGWGCAKVKGMCVYAECGEVYWG